MVIFCQKGKVSGGVGVGAIGGLETFSMGIGVEVGDEVGFGWDSGVGTEIKVGVETTPLIEDLVLADNQFDQEPVAQPLPARTE